MYDAIITPSRDDDIISDFAFSMSIQQILWFEII